MTDDATNMVPTERKGLAYIFVGREGLRAGWSILLFFIFVIVIAFAIALAAKYLHFWRSPPPVKGAPGEAWRTVANDALGFFVIALAALLVSLVERRPFAAYGLRRDRWLPDLLAGMGWGVVMLSLLVGALALTGTLVFEGFALAGLEALRYAVLWLVAFLCVGLFEEYLTRGFLQYTLARGVAGIADAVSSNNPRARTIGFWVAAFFCSVVLFALPHAANGGETPMGLVSVALAGLTFVYALYRTGSLWWAIGFHATWDWAQSYVYGVRDSGLAMQGHLLNSHAAGAPLLSGGTTGPEGSILLVPTMLLTLFIIHRTLPRRPSAFDAVGSGVRG